MSLRILFCYSHEDEAILNKLKAHLIPLQRQGLVDLWYDRDIRAGTVWEQEINNYLETAQIILLLVSSDFMASEYCYSTEMRRAIERHERGEARVIPVILRWVMWKQTPLGKLHALPKDGLPITDDRWSQDYALCDVAEGVYKVVGELNSKPSRPLPTIPLELEPVLDTPQKDKTVNTGSSSSGSRWQAFLTLLVFLFGLPVMWLTFAHAINLGPLFTLIIVFFYELVVFLFGLVNKIWEKLENPWIEQMTRYVQLMFLRPGQKYRRYLRYRYRDLDMKGLNTRGTYALPLDQVFVEPSLVPTPPHSITTDPIQPPSVSPSEGEYSLWDLLSLSKGKDQNFAILGPAGTGKTTLLKYAVLSLLHQRQILPILLFLRNHADSIQEHTDFSLEDAIQDQYQKWSKQTLPSDWLQHRLERGRCLLFLDGLDEVADEPIRRQVVDWVEQQMSAYGKNRFIVTSRPLGYQSTPLTGMTTLKVNNFTPEQVEQFLHNWYLANEVMSSQRHDLGTRINARNGAEDLLKRLHATPALLALAVNPLLLTMIATVHQYRDRLPGKRVSLYDEICEVFLGKHQEAKGLRLELTAAQQRLVLRSLAYHMMVRKIRNISFNEASQVIADPLAKVSSYLSPEMFLQLVEETSALLLEQEKGTYSFAHLTFQEYLAATYINAERLEHILVSQITASWWEETIRLYCAIGDATPIIQAFMEIRNLSVNALSLALECQQEAFQIEQSTKSQFEAFIAQEAENPDSERRQLIAQALFSQRSRQMIALEKGAYIDTSLITHAEYQIFLDERKNVHQPDHWVTSSFPHGSGQTAVLGVRRSDAEEFCIWLTEREAGSWRYRLPSLSESEQAEESASETTKMKVGTGYWVDGDEGFIWAKGTPHQSDNILDQSFVRDYRDAHKQAQSLDSNSSSRQYLDQCLSFASYLREMYELYSALVSALTSIYQHLHDHEGTLQSRLATVHAHVSRLQTEVTTLVRKSTVQARLEAVNSQRSSLEKELVHVNNEIVDTGDTLQRIRHRTRDPEDSIARLTLPVKLQKLRERKEELEKQLVQAYRSKKRLADKYEIAQEDSYVDEVVTDLNRTREQENSQRIKLERFRNLCQPFYAIYENFSHCTPIYNWDQAFSNALLRNRPLDLDPVLISLEDSTLQEALSLTSDRIDAFIRELDSGLSNLSIIGNDYGDVALSSNIKLVLDLSLKLARIPFKQSVGELNHALKWNINQMSKSRPLGRDRGQSRLLRLYIRYFAREIASHLSYWLWKEYPKPPLSQIEIDLQQRVIDSYFDVYVAFAVLEERIEGRLPACEGILIVKETMPTEQKQERA